MARWILAALALASCSRDILEDAAGLNRLQIEHLQKSVPPEAPIFPDDFSDDLTDGSDAVPDYIYDHIAGRLAGMDDDQIHRRTLDDLDVEESIEEPTNYRGRFWRVTGTIARLWAERIEAADAPVKELHAGILFTSAGRPILFHVVQKPEVLYLNQDVVEIEGLFVKTMSYVSQGGGTVEAPFLMGRTARRVF